MIYNKTEMFDMLVERVGLDEETVQLVLKVAGDVPATYIKMLKAETGLNSFIELENSEDYKNYVTYDDGDEDEEEDN